MADSTSSSADPVTAFLTAALVPRDGSHADGDILRAERILAAHPEVAESSIHTAAALGRDQAVRRFLATDPSLATAPGGPYDWDPLTHLCFSNYLKHHAANGEEFVHAARALLDAGASANTGWWEPDHQPEAVWESALYGAAGVAHHPALTQLLLDRGGDPNDGETPYHAPEGYDNRALQVLVRSGKLTPDSLGVILVRKSDWHDLEGIAWLLDQGVDPNHVTRFGHNALQHALMRDNALPIIEALLTHGADPAISMAGHSTAALAAARGRGDVLALLERRGLAVVLHGIEALVAACARDDAEAIATLLVAEPGLRQELQAWAAPLLTGFAGNDHSTGLGHLLDLGLPIDSRMARGDGYWGYGGDSTALHVAAWRLCHDSVRFLVERGADVHARDADGRTPLVQAVRGCVESHWTEWRSPASVDTLLAAGASMEGVPYPSGYDDVDQLIEAAGRPRGT